MSFTFSPATEADREYFRGLHHRTFKEAVEKVFGWDDDVQKGFADEAFDEGVEIIRHGDDVIGILCWCEKDDHVWLSQIMIDTPFQGQGFGKQLVDMIKEDAKKKNKPIRLRALISNDKGFKFYKRHGFTIDGKDFPFDFYTWQQS